jgi:hypothetical protein
MKRLATLAAIGYASIFALVPAANAGTAGPTAFNVTVALTSKCEITSIADVAFTYTSFQPGPATATGGTIDLRCTNTKPYSMALSAYAGTVIGLNYTLDIDGSALPVLGTGTGASDTTHVIGGSMVLGQSGDCNNAVAGSDICNGTDATKTLTITY